MKIDTINLFTDWLKIENIYEDGIIKNIQKEYIYILKIIPINFNLKSEIEKELRSSLEQYTKSFKMGESINLQDIIDISKNVEGIRRVEIKSPQTYTGQKFHLAKCGTITISYKGAESR